MRTPLIPLRYRTESARDLRQDLERMATAIVTWAKESPPESDARPVVAPVGRVVAGFGQILRLGPQEDEWITVQLNKPDPADGGRSLGIARTSALGAVELVCVDCTVNGFARLLLLGDVRMNTVTTDGYSYYLDNQGALNWSYGL